MVNELLLYLEIVYKDFNGVCAPSFEKPD